MSYPYLPVNPCCTDVVLNDPCGCNSVITNTGCNTNNPCSTHLTASSTIVYDGPALTCTTAEPCDKLNVILQKIDEIICNLLTQINILTVQVNNITTQIITINGDIININNQLDVCCNVTTTTTTTAVKSTTTTTTKLEPTTTTTTTTFAGACTCFHVAINQADITNATGNTFPELNGKVYLQTSKDSACEGGDIAAEYSTFTSDGFCILTSEVSSIQLFYYKDDVPIYYPATVSTYNVLYSTCSVNGECLPV
jgi:hypothetical protein